MCRKLEMRIKLCVQKRREGSGRDLVARLGGWNVEGVEGVMAHENTASGALDTFLKISFYSFESNSESRE